MDLVDPKKKQFINYGVKIIFEISGFLE